MERGNLSAELVTERITNILVVGIGGQGVLSATEILAEAAIMLGHDVKQADLASVSRRGGVVSSQLRFGPQVLSSLIAPGSADFLLSLEAAEGMRWQHMLRPAGIAVFNRGRIVPPVVELGLSLGDYPADPVAEVRSAGTTVHALDASEIARSLGDLRLVNTVMLGAMADLLPFPGEMLQAAIRRRFAGKGESLLEKNCQAFAAGRTAGCRR